MSWKDLIFEHESKPASEPVVTHPIGTVPALGTVTIPTATSAPIPAGSDDQFYERLKQNTSVELAASIQKIMSLAKPLENIITDPLVRLKAAVAQAGTQGISLGDVDHDLQTLGNLLTQEAEKFKKALSDRKTTVADKESQAAIMEQKLHDLRVEISDSKTKIDRADTGFQSALARRSSELDQLKNQFASVR